MGEGVCGTPCRGFSVGVRPADVGVASSGGGVGWFVGLAVGEAVRTSKWVLSTTGELDGTGTLAGATEGVSVADAWVAESLKFAATIYTKHGEHTRIQ